MAKQPTVKKVAKQDDDFSMDEPSDGTPQHKARVKEAARKKSAANQPEVKKTWFEFKKGPTYNEKKGLKLVRHQLTENGSTTEWVGWEKKIPAPQMAKIRKEFGPIKNDPKAKDDE